MTLDDYIREQRIRLDESRGLPQFVQLIVPLDRLYLLSERLIPPGTLSLYVAALYLCHKHMRSAAMLIAQGQPEDAGPITRRAIEIALRTLAIKTDPSHFETWNLYEKRMDWWRALAKGETRKYPRAGFLPPLPSSLDPGLSTDWRYLVEEWSILSNSDTHFTPEFLDHRHGVHVGDLTPDTRGPVAIPTFSDREKIEDELVSLACVHIRILALLDSSLDVALGRNQQWLEGLGALVPAINQFAKSSEPDPSGL